MRRQHRPLNPPDYGWVSWVIAIVLGLAIGALTLPLCYPVADLVELSNLPR